MKPTRILLALLVLACAGSLAYADNPRVRDHRQQHHVPVWDARAWTLLGEKTVQGRHDRDTIVVGRYQGRFDQLTLRVENGDVEIVDMVVRFSNGEVFSPKVHHNFRQNARTRVIDLPGNRRIIQRIDLRYRKLSRNRNVQVQVWGRDTRAHRPPAPPHHPPTTGHPGKPHHPPTTGHPGKPHHPPGAGHPKHPKQPKHPRWNPRGWTMLGEATFRGRRDHDTVVIGRDEGRFRQLTFVVDGTDFDMVGMRIHYRKGKPQDIKLSHTFRDGYRHYTFDLPGKRQVIERIDFRYRNYPGAGRARVQVWGR